ncbi:RdgB/HAM1 family non-canonical purine NTP pyrophosphatase [Bathymodiolus septemdierum thioautotrophic gill symbiont]|uniref:dITP/XTP pyrophosphatase n=1 Tax=endosymbiont of Bathymodiolus septemdierum str. Myojin knoll TaxID=1303921 RepID=A0A0P0UQT0_9GAMM|nr:RdgB/HAM1 family non-canonical purine NTP pyrophosphatase [Bathymodiolus septemdierum thioautotrophic gill symbiont]BAS67362.1 dITP/XTP pyrophosphatase [endosymbiont of Bathymodiolus septemdierum str. Myojin knoll]
MQKIILASNNPGKIKEFNAMLEGSYTIVSMQDMGVEEVAETGLTFVENAIIKARNASEQSGLPAIADDSGLNVEALKGEPGIYSARYSGGNDEQNIDKLLQNLQGVKNRNAYFYCAIVFVKYATDPTPIIALGEWHGEILEQRQGENGFGYDAVFYVPELKKSSAELNASVKNTLSHRALAMQDLLKKL